MFTKDEIRQIIYWRLYAKLPVWARYEVRRQTSLGLLIETYMPVVMHGGPSVDYMVGELKMTIEKIIIENEDRKFFNLTPIKALPMARRITKRAL